MADLDSITKRKAFMSTFYRGGFFVEPDSAKPLIWRAAMMNIYGSNIVSTVAITITNAGVIGSGIVGRDTL